MAAGYTIVQYGDLKMYRCVTTYEHRPKFDETNTDFLYQITTVSVEGFIHGHSEWQYQMVSDGTGATYAGLASDQSKAFRMRLQPRQRLRVWMGCSMTGSSAGGNLVDGTIYIDVEAMPLGIVPAPGQLAGVPNEEDEEEEEEVEEDNESGESGEEGNVYLDGFDLNNGPKNLEFNITQVAGNEVFRVTAKFEICHLECPCEECTNTYGVLSNRWSIVDVLDVDMQVTRTYTGTLVVASQNINAQSFRWMTAPPLQPLMRIDSMSFNVSADGLKLNWMVVHKEIASSAPWPARTWSVQHTEEQVDGMTKFAHVDVDLTAMSKVNKADLITLALWIIYAKIYGRTPKQLRDMNQANPAQFISITSQNFLKSISITDYIGDKNRISARAKAQRLIQIKPAGDGAIVVAAAIAAAAAGGAGLAAAGDVFSDTLGVAITQDNLPNDQDDQPPPYQQHWSWGGYPNQTPEFEGPAVLAGIFSCYLQDACNDAHTLYRAGSPKNNPSNSPDQNATELSNQPQVVPIDLTIVPNDTIPSPFYSENDGATDDNGSHPIYTFWQIENLYSKNSLRAQMPIANVPQYGQPNFSPTSTIITLAGTQAKRRVRVSAERAGGEPEFCDPDNFPEFFPPDVMAYLGYYDGQQIQQAALRSKVNISRTTTVLGQLLYRADAVYLLAMSRPVNPGEPLPLGNDKWSSLGNQSTSVDGEITNSDWNSSTDP